MFVDIFCRCFARDGSRAISPCGAASKVVDCPDHRWVLSEPRKGAFSGAPAALGGKEDPQKIETIIIIGDFYYVPSTFLSI